ncbi:hypothetical protein [Aurantiacibacter rhizosphaerae]|uniref:SH3 domain-containing protein n=1 Tax=Aurantiacibacter rhizosphaerae TaxID=2691582 RepID=A0A844XAN8_9SPHN|nr:hypothetical protein [Aurantiacibacter rhizosphaerae]MWV26595.1 hypothetical protein [Aurantiacibacter rhizosphaerae]
MIRPIFVLASALAPFLALSAPAMAQDGDPYAACAATQDDAARLACFDRTYQSQQVVIAEREAVEEQTREEVFGFREEDAVLEREEEGVAMTAAVAEVLQGSGRSQVLLLDNGQLWREINGSTLRNRVRDGWTATITRHWSGAYEMRFDGRSGYLRVSRMR